MAVKLVISDVDGCWVNENKKTIPALESLASQAPTLQRIGGIIRQYPDLHVSLCTTRSLMAGLRIVELAGVRGLCAFEGGGLIYDPASGEAYSLVLRDEAYAQHRDTFHHFQEWVQGLDDAIIAKQAGIPSDQLRRLHDRKTVFTFELLPFESPPCSGKDLYQAVSKHLDQKFLDRLRVNPSAAALDISVPITKADAVRHILQHYELSTGDAVGIGDRYHSDLQLMEQTKYAIAPANADPLLQDHVRQRGECGYISRFKVGKGILDGLAHAVQHWR